MALPRRVLAKVLSLQPLVNVTLCKYDAFGSAGTKKDNTDLVALQLAPPPGHKDKQLWELVDPELGPVGLLLSAGARSAMVPDIGTFTLDQHLEVPLPIPVVPYNSLREAIESRVGSARARAAAPGRTILNGINEIDGEVYRMAVRKLTEEEKKIVAYLFCWGYVVG